ncbi:MAG: DUF2586 family protein [Agriterribacter sp.]
MSLPRVTVIFSNGNLLQDIAAVDGICGLIGTVATPGLVGACKTLYSLDDAIDQGFTEGAEPFMYRHIKEFYGELSGNQKLYIMGVSDATSMASVLDNTSATGAKKLTTFANGEIRVLGVVRKPAVGYDPGANFFDSDVSAAVTAAKVFGNARLAELRPLRILIEGRVTTEGSANIYAPNTADVDFGGVVTGSSLPDGSASVGVALGRASKYAAHIKLGKVANGPLSIDKAYIGTKELKDYPGLEALHDKGVISFMNHTGKAGVYFGIDRMANTKDYRYLAHGRIIDKAALIAAAVYIDQIESEVDVDDDGKISQLELEHLKGILEQAINVYMGNQISGVQITIDPNQNIINTGTLKTKIQILPKGYTTWINIDLGLVAPVAE